MAYQGLCEFPLRLYECNMKVSTAAQAWHCELSNTLVNFGLCTSELRITSVFFCVFFCEPAVRVLWLTGVRTHIRQQKFVDHISACQTPSPRQFTSVGCPREQRYRPGMCLLVRRRVSFLYCREAFQFPSLSRKALCGSRHDAHQTPQQRH